MKGESDAVTGGGIPDQPLQTFSDSIFCKEQLPAEAEVGKLCILSTGLHWVCSIDLKRSDKAALCPL